jgi:hypothetical protein
VFLHGWGVTKRYPIFVDQDITSSKHHPILGMCLLLATIGEPVTGHSILQMFAIAIAFLYRSIIEASSVNNHVKIYQSAIEKYTTLETAKSVL